MEKIVCPECDRVIDDESLHAMQSPATGEMEWHCPRCLILIATESDLQRAGVL